MIRPVLFILLACAGCVSDDHDSRAVADNIAAQHVPQPQRTDALEGGSGEVVAAAVKRWRTDKVKPLRNESGRAGGSAGGAPGAP